MNTIPLEMQAPIRSATRNIRNAMRGLAANIMLSNTTHEHFEEYQLAQYYPTCMKDVETGRRVYANTPGTHRYVDTNEPCHNGFVTRQVPFDISGVELVALPGGGFIVKDDGTPFEGDVSWMSLRFDPQTDREVYIDTSTNLYFVDTNEPFTGTHETVIDEDAVMPFGEDNLTVRDYLEMADFNASLTYYALGNCYENKATGERDETLTALGKPPLTHAQMHSIRRKHSLPN